MNQNFRNFALWAVILLLLVALFNLFQSPAGQSGAREINYSQFRSDVNDGRVESVVISGQDITGKYTDDQRFRTVAPESADYVTLLEERGVSIQARQDEGEMSFLSVLISWFPMFLLIAVWIFFMRQMQGAGGRAMGFGKSKASC
jgi:cell division protease FtsH